MTIGTDRPVVIPGQEFGLVEPTKVRTRTDKRTGKIALIAQATSARLRDDDSLEYGPELDGVVRHNDIEGRLIDETPAADNKRREMRRAVRGYLRWKRRLFALMHEQLGGIDAGNLTPPSED